MAQGIWNRIKNLLHRNDVAGPQAEEQGDVLNPCCDQPEVHIAYRGKSDERMYIAYNRTWQEVRYFDQNGLRVFCKTVPSTSLLINKTVRLSTYRFCYAIT